MNESGIGPRPAGETSDNRAFWWLAVFCVLLAAMGIWLQSRVGWSHRADGQERSLAKVQLSEGSSSEDKATPVWKRFSDSPRTAEEIVQSKLVQFGKSRRAIVQRIAERDGATMPAEVAEFFDALERGNWEEIERRFQAFADRSGQYDGSTHDPSINAYWPAILEAYGAVEQAHEWPADELLKYGESILGSLRPGMVYVGGTDPGRFVPTFLNESSGSDPHMILTQNALADSRYLEYARFLYGEQMGLPTEEDAKRIFEEYIEEARRRLDHDQQFPDEPKQIKPGEDVRIVDGKTTVSGQIAVMAINERLMQDILLKNPQMSFAMEESFPLKGLYKDATSLGPIMELRAENDGALSVKQATSSLEYWQETAQEIRSDSSASESALKTYSHMAVAQANLLSEKNYAAEAEKTLRLAAEIWPQNPEAASGLARILDQTGRTLEAQRLLADFQIRNPGLRDQLEKLRPPTFQRSEKVSP